ncbi:MULTISPECIES: RlmE family RNA methyltransferase [Nitrosomonas]|uniref:Ribosomal RNA large subunit methyltransferase E n=1 Tax=Nitrosomonas communis TaxID=44574 RepID=A0A0F7KCX7_9PROT|nr:MULTISPECIES: SAM-dependent methyltransferase [Nitrosomonas]AKH37436.1 23S rRNA methyltransferase [Nitrosomonas communis]TYP91377.1 23S rRNA (uridine2552-2'-O)-methyltransferase [Nitrosomonas communis]UVS62663.1 23S rRNA methyltransferase [Nitrosomonas sp. PLL12]
MKSAKTSKAWMKEHVNDFFVKQARKEGYRSRAAYKLKEIAERDQLFKPGMTVIDLGAAPGGWSQVAIEKIGKNGKVFALDILEMPSLRGVTFIQGDFSEEAILREFKTCLGNCSIDLVISDMSPNIAGIGVSDHARSSYLAELALVFSREQLNPGGNFLVKFFQGSNFDQYLKDMRASFKKVVVRKPKASRDRSSELYLLGLEKIC